MPRTTWSGQRFFSILSQPCREVWPSFTWGNTTAVRVAGLLKASAGQAGCRPPLPTELPCSGAFPSGAPFGPEDTVLTYTWSHVATQIQQGILRQNANVFFTWHGFLNAGHIILLVLTKEWSGPTWKENHRPCWHHWNSTTHSGAQSTCWMMEGSSKSNVTIRNLHLSEWF